MLFLFSALLLPCKALPLLFQSNASPASSAHQFRTDVALTSAAISSNEDRIYWSCIVRISNCSFTGLNASAPAYGSAVYGIHSQLSVNASTFVNCSASVGGAICAVSSVLSVVDSIFRACVSFGTGGAVVAMSDESGVWVFMAGTVFTQCEAREKCGAVSLSDVQDFVIELCTFEQCCAGMGSGGIGFVNCNGLIFRTLFVNNSCGVGWGGGAMSFSVGN
jgi:hypothetical protein